MFFYILSAFYILTPTLLGGRGEMWENRGCSINFVHDCLKKRKKKKRTSHITTHVSGLRSTTPQHPQMHLNMYIYSIHTPANIIPPFSLVKISSSPFKNCWLLFSDDHQCFTMCFLSVISPWFEISVKSRRFLKCSDF